MRARVFRLLYPGAVNLRILQLTDLHVFAEPTARLKGIPTRETLGDVLSHIRENELPFDHVVITGDHTHDELPESYAAVARLLTSDFAHFWSVPGNHDDRTVLRGQFGDRVSGEGTELINFEFADKDWLCLGLDTHLPGQVPGKIEAEQIAWAKERVSNATSRNVALFFHHPPVDVNSIWMDQIGLNGRELVTDWIKSEPRIRVVCCGHVHHEFHARVGNADIYTTPSTGIQFDPAGETPRFATAPPGYRVIELEGDAVSTRVVRLPQTRHVPIPD